jgi:transposase
MKEKKAKKDRDALEARRMRAAALFQEGKSQAEVARLLHVSREATSNWFEKWKKYGIEGLKKAPIPRRVPKLSIEKFEELKPILMRGPKAYGYHTDKWNMPQIASVVEKLFHVRYNPNSIRNKLLQLEWGSLVPLRRQKRKKKKA